MSTGRQDRLLVPTRGDFDHREAHVHGRRHVARDESAEHGVETSNHVVDHLIPPRLRSDAPEGLENYFAAVFDPATDDSGNPPQQSPQFIERALALAPKYGLVLLLPA